MSVFVRNRLTAVNAVKVAGETAEATRLQFQCEMFTERLTTSLSLWYPYRSCLNAHHDVSPPCSPIPASLVHSSSLYPLESSRGTGENPRKIGRCFNWRELWDVAGVPLLGDRLRTPSFPS